MRAALRFLPFVLIAALLYGCSQGPSGSGGETVSASDLKKRDATAAASGGVPPPAPPSDSAPGTSAGGAR